MRSSPGRNTPKSGWQRAGGEPHLVCGPQRRYLNGKSNYEVLQAQQELYPSQRAGAGAGERAPRRDPSSGGAGRWLDEYPHR